MKKPINLLYFLGLFVIIFLYSCNAEDNLTPPSQAQSINNAKVWFESNNEAKTLKILKYTKEILWEKAIVSNGENGLVIEVPLTLVDNIATANDKTKPLKDYHRLMFLKDENDNFKSYHIQIFTDDITYNNLDKKFNFYNINHDFNGLVTVFDADSQSVNLLQFKNGQKQKPNISSRMGEDEITCTYLGYLHEDGTFEPIALLYCIGGGDYEGTGGGGGYGSGPHGGGDGSSTTNAELVDVSEEIEEQIKDSLDPCLKGVLDKLKNATNADIANILKKLGANSLYTVNMVMEPAATYAETQRISKNNYVIRVDRDRYTDGTKLFKATALIHEVIHAYFLSIVDDYNYNYPTNAPMADFPSLFEAYVKKTFPNSNDTRDAQHKEMADKYVDAMASALQEYDANFTVPYQVYQDLAWGGLKDAPIFDKTFPPGSAESIRITNRYKAESTGHSVGDGTPNAQTPVGKPCN